MNIAENWATDDHHVRLRRRRRTFRLRQHGGIVLQQGPQIQAPAPRLPSVRSRRRRYSFRHRGDGAAAPAERLSASRRGKIRQPGHPPPVREHGLSARPSGRAVMTRTHRTTSAFARPLRLRGVDRVVPAGSYDIVTEEELIEGLSFPVYRRVSTVIFVPGQLGSSVEMVTIDPLDLAAAQGEDADPRHEKAPPCLP